MPLRPFPYPFRVGIDICHIPRIGRILNPMAMAGGNMDRDGVIRKLHLFLRRLFTDYEEAGFWRRHTWDQRLLKHNISNNVVLRHLAGRWAAKEAIIKACPRRIHFHNILIAASENNKPYGVILDTPMDRLYTSYEILSSYRPGPAGKFQFVEGQLQRGSLVDLPLIEDINGQVVPLSISHDGDYAIAVAYCPEEKPGDGQIDGSLFDDLMLRLSDRASGDRSALHDR